MAIDIPLQEEQAVEPQQTFPEIARQLQTLEIPGEQQGLNMWISTLQRANRDLPLARTHGDLGKTREDLRKLLEGSLGRSINSYKRAAAGSLQVGLQGSRAELLLSVNEAQGQLLLRAQETVAITLGTMQRYNDLEKLQVYWNEIVSSLPRGYADVVKAVRDRGYQGEMLDRKVNLDIFHSNLGVFGRLSELKGEPYRSKALEFINRRDRIFQLWENRNLEPFFSSLEREAAEAEVWKRRVREEYEGVDFGKYALS